MIMNDARAPYCLTVLSGANAGATATLGTGRTVIGGAAGDGIILDGALPGQLSVTLSGERARLAAGGAGVGLGDGIGPVEPLKQGQTRIVALPAMVRLNEDTVLNIARRVPVQGRAVPAATAALASIVALACGLLVGLQLPDSVRLASEMTAQAAPTPAAQAPALADTVPARGPTAPLQAVSPRMGPCEKTCQSSAAAQLAERFKEQGLEGLSVAPGSGVLRVTGTLAPEQAQRWGDLRQDFETTYGGSLPLIVALKTGSEAPALAVSSIWLGPRPELRTRSGEVLRLGDRTGDGWTVKRIERGAITLTRNDVETVVRY